MNYSNNNKLFYSFQNISREELYLECLKFGLPVRSNDDKETLEAYLKSILFDDIFERPLDEQLHQIIHKNFTISINKTFKGFNLFY